MKSNFETISFLWVISVSLTSPFLQVSASKSFWSLWSKPCEERWKSRANSQADNDPWNGHWKVIQPASIFYGAVSPGHEDCNNSKVVGYLTDGEAHSATENFAPRMADSKWFGKQDMIRSSLNYRNTAFEGARNMVKRIAAPHPGPLK